MARNTVQWAFGIGILILIVGIAMPVMISSTTQDASTATILDENETAELTDTLQIGLEDVQTSSNYTNNATVSLTNLRDYSTTEATINDSANETLSLSGEDIVVDVDLRSSSSALLSTTYPATFGWNDGATTIVENLDVIMVVTAIIIITALLVHRV